MLRLDKLTYTPCNSRYIYIKLAKKKCTQFEKNRLFCARQTACAMGERKKNNSPTKMASLESHVPGKYKRGETEWNVLNESSCFLRTV